jgi:threonine 3-dehydrogenase
MHNSILVTGANGQLGTVLTAVLQDKYGQENVVASDLRPAPSFVGRFETLDVTDVDRLTTVIRQHNITEVYHLAAILSANGEKNPLGSWDLNMKTWLNVLEVARQEKVNKVFYPSSIAVFGASAAKANTPNNSFLDPLTAYGISKAAGENWANYYFQKYGLDVRSLRYPGIIGHQSNPGGGTTDYAVDIFHYAVKKEPFTCFLKENTALPMIFMDDAVRATVELMDAPKENIRIRTSYNIAGTSFTPAEVTSAIQNIYPDFKVTYSPDSRQEIADNWPDSISDAEARKDWAWKPVYLLQEMTETMLEKLKEKYISQAV